MLGLKLCEVLKESGFNLKKERFNIASSKETKRISKKFENINSIIHCAAVTEVNKCENNKARCFKVNVIGTRNVVDLARFYDANLIYISTPMIFSGRDGNYKEDDTPEPVNYYAKSKMYGEREVLKYSKGLVIRANPIGVRPPGAHPSFIQWFVNAAKENKSFTLFNDVKINPISTLKFSEIIASLLMDFKPGILHLGSSDIVNKADIWWLIVSKFLEFKGRVSEKSVNKTKAGQIAKRPKEMWLNVEKAVSLGYEMPSWKGEVDLVVRELL